MPNYLSDCNSGGLKVDDRAFQNTWCQRCRQRECDLAVYAKLDPMAHRNATWRQRFFEAPQADLSVPKYAQIAQQNFPNLLRKALQLEISSQRSSSDWSVPDIPILGQTRTPQVEEALRQSQHVVAEEPMMDEDLEVDDDLEVDNEPLVESPPSARPLPKVTSLPQQRNLPDPGEVWIGDVPVLPPPQTVNPWAPPPKPKEVVVKTGARVQFGPDGKGKVLNE